MIQTIKNLFTRHKPEMVSYWKTKEYVEAKVVKTPEGHYVMHMEGEKYPFPGHPRGSLLYGKLSPLKHMIKNRIFNESWALLEAGKSKEEILNHITNAWKEIFVLAQETKYDMLPQESLVPAVKEIWRAMSAIEEGRADRRAIKEVICFILQEDDAYRFRFQWIAKFIKKPTDFIGALKMMEHAEVVGDMKERVRLVTRVLSLYDTEYFNRLLRELNWSKLQLSIADKYFFRAKYFKVDYPENQY